MSHYAPSPMWVVTCVPSDGTGCQPAAVLGTKTKTWQAQGDSRDKLESEFKRNRDFEDLVKTMLTCSLLFIQ
jgi:hypothetical protein